jgi:hypothetical protein
MICMIVRVWVFGNSLLNSMRCLGRLHSTDTFPLNVVLQLAGLDRGKG